MKRGNKIHAVFFDIGGVLVKELPPNAVWEATIRRATKKFNVPLGRARAYFDTGATDDLDRGLITEFDFWNDFSKLGDKKPSRNEIKKLFRLRRVKLKKTLLEIVKKIKNRKRDTRRDHLGRNQTAQRDLFKTRRL